MMLYSVSHLFRRPSERERETVSFSNEYIGSCLLHLKLLSALPKTAYYPVRYIAMARERERAIASIKDVPPAPKTWLLPYHIVNSFRPEGIYTARYVREGIGSFCARDLLLTSIAILISCLIYQNAIIYLI